MENTQKGTKNISSDNQKKFIFSQNLTFFKNKIERASSVEEFSGIFHVNSSTMYPWIRGERMPRNPTLLQKMAVRYGLLPQQLYTIEIESKSNLKELIKENNQRGLVQKDQLHEILQLELGRDENMVQEPTAEYGNSTITQLQYREIITKLDLALLKITQLDVEFRNLKSEMKKN